MDITFFEESTYKNWQLLSKFNVYVSSQQSNFRNMFCLSVPVQMQLFVAASFPCLCFCSKIENVSNK